MYVNLRIHRANADYSVTKRSVKLLTLYYVIMQVVFVSVGMLSLTAYVRLPDLLRDVRHSSFEDSLTHSGDWPV